MHIERLLFYIYRKRLSRRKQKETAVKLRTGFTNTGDGIVSDKAGSVATGKLFRLQNPTKKQRFASSHTHSNPRL